MDSAGITALIYVGTMLTLITIGLVALIVITWVPGFSPKQSGSARPADSSRLGHGKGKMKG